jgi:hypothetical protein
MLKKIESCGCIKEILLLVKKSKALPATGRPIGL